MKRRVFTILVFLVLGAIVNVAAAWWLYNSILVMTETVLKRASIQRELAQRSSMKAQ